MIKKGTGKWINKISDSPSLFEIEKKMHFVELLNSFREYYECDRKSNKQKYG